MLNSHALLHGIICEGGEDALATFLSRFKVSLCLRALKCSFETLKVQAFLKIKRLHESHVSYITLPCARCAAATCSLSMTLVGFQHSGPEARLCGLLFCQGLVQNCIV